MPNEKKPVGYKNPPHHTRFKPGQCGNPKGRPKKVNGVSTFADLLKMEIPISIGGKKTKVTALEAVSRVILSQALKAEPRALKLFVDLARQNTVGEEPIVEGGRNDAGEELRRRIERLVHNREVLKEDGIDFDG